MSYPSGTFQEAVELSIAASNQLHQILNGDSTTEVTVEDGSKIPSVRKAYTDSLFFLPPKAWVVGDYETAHNQLRAFTETNGVVTWWFPKTATVSTPTLMSITPHDDSNWTLWNAIGLISKNQYRVSAVGYGVPSNGIASAVDKLQEMINLRMPIWLDEGDYLIDKTMLYIGLMSN